VAALIGALHIIDSGCELATVHEVRVSRATNATDYADGMTDGAARAEDAGSFGPHIGGDSNEWGHVGKLAVDDPAAAWRRLLEITATTDDAGLFWVADILEDLVVHHPSEFVPRIEAELASNRRLRQAFLDFVPLSPDEALNERLLLILRTGSRRALDNT
jgi:hypothetical protein